MLGALEPRGAGFDPSEPALAATRPSCRTREGGASTPSARGIPNDCTWRPAGTVTFVWFPFLLKSALWVVTSKRGRRLATVGALGARRAAQSRRARAAYARGWRIASDPRPRRAAGKVMKSTVSRVRR